MTEPENLVFISGASSGIGQAMAQAVPFPARVLDLSRRGGGAGVEHVKADLATTEGWRAAAACFERELAGFAGVRAVFVHAAGTLTPIGFAGEVDPEGYRDQVLLNAAAPAILGDAFLRAFAASRAERGLVLMISSGAASSVYPGWSAYCAGKAALDQWVRTVGEEQHERGDRCRVVAVAPGIVETAMQREIRETAERDFPEVERFKDLHAEGALKTPEQAARELWELLESEPENGSVLDVRES